MYLLEFAFIFRLVRQTSLAILRHCLQTKQKYQILEFY